MPLSTSVLPLPPVILPLPIPELVGVDGPVLSILIVVDVLEDNPAPEVAVNVTV